jgi:hypothetical protein
MRELLESRVFYILFPLYSSLMLIGVFYYVPDGFFFSLISLFLIITPIVILSLLIYPEKLFIGKSYRRVDFSDKYTEIAIVFGVIVILSGPFDVLVNGFKLADPLSYAEFHSFGRYIRHVSIFCWVLVPISFLCLKGRWLRFIFIAYAILFPIIIIDRNRLFMSFYCLIFCNIFTSYGLSKQTKSNEYGKLRLVGLFVASALIFSILGLFRSGDSFLVGSSGRILSQGELPLKEIFYDLPELVQQIFLYITTPIFNFSTMVYYDFLNETFLLSQISPFGRDLYDAYPYAPVMVERFNVGTEFYPWLLYGGLPLVVLSFIFMFVAFMCSARLMHKHPNIFTLLIFLRISYLMLFMGFAPQFYILWNMVFILAMLFLWGVGVLLTKDFLFSSPGA